MDKTNVMFRKFQGEIIAVFPNDSAGWGMAMSYQHIGQHSSCESKYIIQSSKPATVLEYADLKIELESIGYNLNIVKRRDQK
jgi:hypothetical protein